MLNLRKHRGSGRTLVRAGIADGSRAFTGPEHVVIDLTNRCNNSCIACWTRSPLLGDKGPAPAWHDEELKLARVLELIDELARMGTRIIRFTGGGEPFMHAGIYEIIRAVKSKGIFCALTTNFNPIGRRGAERLISAGVDELSVSLWACDAQEYVRTHPNQTAQSFEKITAVLKHMARARRHGRLFRPRTWWVPPAPRINLLNVVCSLNYRSIVKMFDYALAVQADSIYYTVVDPVPGATDGLLLNPEQRDLADGLCAQVCRKNDRLPRSRRLVLDNFSGFRARLRHEDAGPGEYDSEAVNEIPCYVGWIFCRIMADGRVAPCCRGVQIPMGDIYRDTFEEIWNSKRYNHFRKKAKHSNKNDRYFSRVGCTKTCDNLMHNLEVHRWLGSEAGP